MAIWYGSAEALGYIPQIITSDDPRPVVEQVNDRYAHGGGWNSFGKGKWVLNRKAMSITYPCGDEPDETYLPVAHAQISETEAVWVYHHAWVLIDRGGDDWEVSRMD